MKLTDLRMKQTGLRKFPRQQGDKAAKILDSLQLNFNRMFNRVFNKSKDTL